MKSRIRFSQKSVPFSREVNLDSLRIGQMVREAWKRGLSGEDLGVYGLLRQMTSEYSDSPLEQLSFVDRLAALRHCWVHGARKENSDCLAFKLVFELEPEFLSRMATKSVPMAETFTDIVVSTLRHYQQKFYPGQQLGYLYNLRRVGSRTQAWVLLYPVTDKGWAVMLSPSIMMKTSEGKLISADHARFIRDIIQGLGDAVFSKKVLNPVRNFASLDVDPIQEQLLTDVALKQLKDLGKTGHDLSKYLPDQRMTIVVLPEFQIRNLLKDAYDKWTDEWNKTNPTNAKAFIEKANAYIALLGSKLKEEANKHSEVLTRAIRDIRKSGIKFSNVSRVKSVRLGWRTYRSILPKISRWIDEHVMEPWGSYKPLWKVVEDAQLAVADISPESTNPISLVDPLYHTLTARRIVQNTLLAVKIVCENRTQNSKVHIETAMVEKRTKVEKLRRVRLLLHLQYLQVLVAKASISGKRPEFLQMYGVWQKRSQPIPVHISRRVSGDPQSRYERDNRRRQELTRVKPLTIAQTLSSSLYCHDHNPLNLTSPSIPLVTESVFSQDLTGQGPNSVTSEIDETRTPQEILDSPVEKEIVSLINNNSDAVRNMLRTPKNRRVERSSTRQVLDEHSPEEFIKAGL